MVPFHKFEQDDLVEVFSDPETEKEVKIGIFKLTAPLEVGLPFITEDTYYNKKKKRRMEIPEGLQEVWILEVWVAEAVELYVKSNLYKKGEPALISKRRLKTIGLSAAMECEISEPSWRKLEDNFMIVNGVECF